IGFTAAKLEATFSGPYAHKGLQGPDEWVDEVVRAVRETSGPEMTLMVDVQYAFDSVKRALRTAEAPERYNVYFLETPLRVEDRDLDLGRGAACRGHTADAVLRVPAGRAVRVALAQGARPRPARVRPRQPLVARCPGARPRTR